MAIDTFHQTFFTNSPLVVGHTTPNGQGSFLLNNRVEAYTNFVMQVASTGGATYSLQLEGSLDNLNWFVIGTPITTDGIYGLTGSGNYAVWTRLNVTDVTGGTSPTITASYVAVS